MTTGRQSIDVTIRGAGIFGLSIAWACARRGARVRVVDPHGIGAGASGGIVGALSPHTPENWNPKKAFQLESLLMAPDWWADVASVGGADPGYGRTGRLQPIAHDKALALAHDRGRQAADLWQGKAVWQVVAADGLSAWAPPSASGWLIHDTLSARIHPRQALAALARAIAARGGEIAAEGAEEGKVVWATGHHDLTYLGVDGAAQKGQAALFALSAPDRPQLFVDGMHIIPHADGTVAVGSTSERDWTDASATDALLEALIGKACAVLPALAEAAVIERWAGLRPRSATRAPIMGLHPGRPGAFIANGGFKIGFGMAPLIAEVMADLVLEGRDRIPEDFRA
ncbi:NAD(P)/FAD-dependent oxidoreductase [Flavimaricola marinus]|uniref:Glycine oxidase n=1 Tax=Flavimaricola marinus TaxID=1819565 RepID=A0A238LFL4_9RHOB|nr:FAD-dependent oxidoreductase [Flavimaricola marinus]SMY08373.1 Glycine oxidase [Flavimaricola marinus]